MYFETVACETATPSFSSSPWILGAPREDWRRSSAESDPAVPSQSRADPVAADSSTPSSVEIPGGTTQLPFGAAFTSATVAFLVSLIGAFLALVIERA